VVNWAAGIDGDEISMHQIEKFAEQGMLKVYDMLNALTAEASSNPVY
jgi:hypothetical protein